MLKNKIVVYAGVLLVVVVAIIFIALLLRNNNTSNVFSSKVCWNNVFVDNGNYYWKDGCKGAAVNPNLLCTQVLVELSDEEKKQYLEWEKNGKSLDDVCSVNTAQNIDRTSSTSESKPIAFTSEELSGGDTSNNCLVAKDGSVYLIPQSYQKEHPGGASKITEQCGKDITKIFNLEHSGNSAELELENFYVGELVD